MRKAIAVIVLCLCCFICLYAAPETITSRLNEIQIEDSKYKLFWFDENLVEKSKNETEIMISYMLTCHPTDFDGVWLQVLITDFYNNQTAINRGWDVYFYSSIFEEFATLHNEKHTMQGQDCELVSYTDYTMQGQERLRVVLKQHIVEGIYWYFCSNILERDGDLIYFSITYLSGEEDTAKIIENCMINQTLT